MPRRNRPAPRRVRVPTLVVESPPVSTEQMARSLVERGLAPSVVLGPGAGLVRERAWEGDRSPGPGPRALDTAAQGMGGFLPLKPEPNGP